MAALFPRSANPSTGWRSARSAVALGGLPAVSIGWARTPYATGRAAAARAAHQVRSPPPRARRRHRLPLLPRRRERAPYAGVPATSSVHGLPQPDLDRQPRARAPCERATSRGRPFAGIASTRFPDFVFFNHSIHVNKGVGCVTCHGRVDRDGAGLRREAADDALVPRLPSRSARSTSARSTRSPTWSGSPTGRRRPRRGSSTQQLERALHRRTARGATDDASTRTSSYAIALDEVRDPLARREFMKLMGAALGPGRVVGACTRAPTQEIVPYVVQPPEVHARRAPLLRDGDTLDGYATGVLVESHEGRPTKIEGNPEHPASLGATGVFEQAVRARPLRSDARARRRRRGAVDDVGGDRDGARPPGRGPAQRGRGLHLLLEPTSSPTVATPARRAPRALARGARCTFTRPRRARTRGRERGSRSGAVLEPRLDSRAAPTSSSSLDADFLAERSARTCGSRDSSPTAGALARRAAR